MIRLTYRRQGSGVTPYEYFTKTPSAGGIDVHGWGSYGPHSVLAGQSMKSFLDFFTSEAECDKALVDAGIDPADVSWSSKWVEPQNSFNHLPDEPDW